MEKLELDLEQVRQIYDTSNDAEKRLFHRLYGKKVFDKKVTERITGIAEACIELGLTSEEAINAYLGGPKNEKSFAAYGQLIVIAAALNEGWVPNWNDNNERKWYPWFKYTGSGFGFSDMDLFCTRTFTGLGSRLVFKSQELAEHAGRAFESIYNDFLSI